MTCKHALSYLNIDATMKDKMNEKENRSHKTERQKTEDSNRRVIRTEDGSEFIVNQETLASCSDYFKRLFLYESKENILIRDISGQTLHTVISFFDQKIFSLNSTNVVEILKAADYMVLVGLLKKIRSSLPDLMSNENIFDLHQLALELNHLNMLKLVQLYLKLNFQTVLNHSNIGELPLNHFVYLLKDNYLNIDTEELTWDAIVKWVDYDQETRLQYVPALLLCIRLEDCNISLIQKILDHTMLQENEFFGCLREFKRSPPEVQRSQLMEVTQKLSSEPVNFGSRLPQHLLCHVFCETLDANMTDNDNIYHMTISVCSPVDEKSTIVVDKEIDFLPSFVFSSGHKLFVFGNDDFEQHVFDITDKSEINFSDPTNLLHNPKCSYSCVNDRLFACLISLKTPEIVAAAYDAESDNWQVKSSFTFSSRIKWRKVDYIYFSSAPLEKSIVCFSIILVDRSFAFHLSAIYNTEGDSWSTFEMPQVDREIYLAPYLIAYHGALYMNFFRSLQVIRFDPCEGHWKPFQELPPSFRYACPVVHNGTSLVYNTKNARQSVYWNEESQQWELLEHPLVLECDVTDKEVVRKFHFEFLQQEWETAVADCVESENV